MYFTACKPVDRNTECDALCGNREEKGGREEEKERERGVERLLEPVLRQTREETRQEEVKCISVCVCARARVHERN